MAVMQPSKLTFVSLRFRSILWLFFALTMVVVTISLWMYAKANAKVENTKATGTEKIVTVNHINVNKRIEHLENLETDVTPIEFETVIRDMRDYPDEFIDQNFLTKNTDKWTVKVMDVGSHDTITDYLQRRSDREKFYYFRYTDNNNQLRYVLIYDLGEQLDSTMQLIQETEFNLPESVKVEPEEVNRFISIIDNYERAEVVLDMSTNRPRSIILKKTSREVAVRAVTRSRPNKATSKKTITTKKKPVRNVKPIIQKELRKPLKKQNNTTPPKPHNTQPTSNKTITNTPKRQNTKKPEPKPKPFVPNSPPNG